MRKLSLLVFLLILATITGCSPGAVMGTGPFVEAAPPQSLALGLSGVWELESAQVVFDDPESVFTSILAGEASQVPLVNPEDYPHFGDGSGYFELNLSLTLDIRDDGTVTENRVILMDGVLQEDVTSTGSWEVLEDDLNGNGYVFFDFQPLDGYFYTWVELQGSNRQHQDWDWERTQDGNDSCVYTADYTRSE
jgi:hypothetical protein